MGSWRERQSRNAGDGNDLSVKVAVWASLGVAPQGGGGDTDTLILVIGVRRGTSHLGCGGTATHRASECAIDNDVSVKVAMWARCGAPPEVTHGKSWLEPLGAPAIVTLQQWSCGGTETHCESELEPESCASGPELVMESQRCGHNPCTLSILSMLPVYGQSCSCHQCCELCKSSSRNW
jgi:hypothetical protein